MRRLGTEAAERVRTEHPETHRLVVAWVAGVNARIDEILEGRAPLPYGFQLFDYAPERWDTIDPYAVGKLILFNNANQLEFDLLATLLESFAGELADAVPIFAPFGESFTLPPEERPATGDVRTTRAAQRLPIALPPDARERLARFSERMRDLRPGASNNWAIDGRHTRDGRPLIAGDPHQPLASPAVFHMQHLRSDDGALGGGLRVRGHARGAARSQPPRRVDGDHHLSGLDGSGGGARERRGRAHGRARGHAAPRGRAHRGRERA
jgi:penicillin amidase